MGGVKLESKVGTELRVDPSSHSRTCESQLFLELNDNCFHNAEFISLCMMYLQL